MPNSLALLGVSKVLGTGGKLVNLSVPQFSHVETLRVISHLNWGYIPSK